MKEINYNEINYACNLTKNKKKCKGIKTIKPTISENHIFVELIKDNKGKHEYTNYK